jgi:hypothetical protein
VEIVAMQAHCSCRTGTRYLGRSPRACELCAICNAFSAGGVC